jgi:two-component system, chemotaxis family, protein-glutamate methylesterase/glutaminase
MNSAADTTDGGPPATPFRVMIVDDSAVIRGLETRILEADRDIKVISSVGDGSRAVKALELDDSIEVVILDIEMPIMDGLTALPKLIALRPDIKVIMSSTLTLQNADISLKALSMGAADYIPKPSSMTGVSGSQDFRHDLLSKVRALAAAKRHHSGAPETPPKAVRIMPKPGGSAPTEVKSVRAESKPRPGVYKDKQIVLREKGRLTPTVLAIGSSTGGPQALFDLFTDLKDSIRLPVFITQHMPPTFTTILAERISRLTGGSCAEGKDGEIVKNGRIYLAPGDHHMKIVTEGGNKVIKLDQSPPENFCRPAVDPMLRSLDAEYGGRVLTVILTGMGADGFAASKNLVVSGGTVVAQDDDTSVVWGMPGAVATGGLCTAVLPLKKIAPAVQRLIAGEAA